MSLPIKNKVSAWLKASGEHADIVLSSRIRLARNLKDYSFSSQIAREDEEPCLLGDPFFAEAPTGQHLRLAFSYVTSEQLLHGIETLGQVLRMSA